MRTPLLFLLLLSACCVLPTGEVFGDETTKKRTLGVAEEWEMAALNRDWAAATQEKQAEDLIGLADEFARKDVLNDTARRTDLNRAGDLQKAAGDLFGGAVGNYDKAVGNWRKAETMYARLSERKEERRNAAKMAVRAAERALESCRRAAEAYELAAEAYGSENANQLTKAAGASEKAASWRERLAVRK